MNSEAGKMQTDISPDLKSRIFAATRAVHAPTRAEVARKSAAAMLLGSAWMLGVFVAAGGVRSAPRPAELIAGTVVGAALMAGVAMWAGVLRGGSMLGRSRRALVAVITCVPVV